MQNIGYRIYTKINRPSRQLVENFAGIPVANIADNMNRSFCIDARIRPFNAVPLLGIAFTVKTRPGDNLLLHKAIDMIQAGDVIVVSGEGELANALIGELMIAWAQKRGAAGFVIDGAVRDSATLRKLAVPVYAAGITSRGPYKDGPGEINVPVSLGGVVIKPGDILVGDADSIVVINPQEASGILEQAKATMAKEADIMKSITAGTWDRSWVDKTLQGKGCEFIDEEV